MADAMAFLPQEGSEYAFPADQGAPDEVEQAAQQTRQIQSSFDQQRYQRAFIQNVAKSAAKQGSMTAQQKIDRDQASRQLAANPY
jgi:hypothetical protein